MKNKINFFLFTILFLVLMMGCSTYQKSIQTDQDRIQTPPPAPPPIQKKEPAKKKDEKGFKIKPVEMEIKAGRSYLPVGAELVSKGGKADKVYLYNVIKRLADLKGLSVSWANDVNSVQLVHVNIRPEDNFWEALDNILRQLDYFYKMDKDTIVVNYKETKQYQLVMPNLKENFRTKIGGNLIGGGAVEGRITGRTEIEANIAQPLDFWKTIQDNLHKIINSGARRKVQKAGGKQAPTAQPTYDKGFFIADKNLGIITVTAPRKTQKKVREYLDNLKKIMYKQVVIEAKIVEVFLNDSSEFGIDWSDILNRTFGGTIQFGTGGAAGTIYPYHHMAAYNGLKFLNNITLAQQTFSIMMGFLKDYGKTNVLSNPKITIMNGHGASITVGTDITYIDKVTSTSDDTGNVTYTVTTASVLSGLGLAVMANIINDDEVILYIVPVTSELQPAAEGEDIQYITFGGADGAQVGLPRVRLREMATMTRVKNGETLIIGGHIDKSHIENDTKVPLLGDIPLIGWLFKHESKTTVNRELAIFLTPKIISSYKK